VETTLGRLVGVGADGQPWIDLPTQGRTGVSARTTVPLGASLIGRELLVSFLDGRADQPVVTGVVRAPGDPATVASAANPARAEKGRRPSDDCPGVLTRP